MSPDDDERPAKAVAQEMDDEAERMESRIDELGDHVEEAKKKAAEARPREGLAGDPTDDEEPADDEG
jgi:hypothetical protein